MTIIYLNRFSTRNGHDISFIWQFSDTIETKCVCVRSWHGKYQQIKQATDKPNPIQPTHAEKKNSHHGFKWKTFHFNEMEWTCASLFDRYISIGEKILKKKIQTKTSERIATYAYWQWKQKKKKKKIEKGETI